MDTSTNAASRTLEPTNWPASLSAISSQGLADGPSRFDSLGGLTIAEFGLALAHANLSARQAKAVGLLTTGISGPTGSTSSRSAALASSLASKLQARTASLGSTLFTLTWKARSTPSGLKIFALRASVRRTSDSDCTSWPTAKSTDGSKGGGLSANGQDLVTTALLAAWGTPTASEPGGSAQAFIDRKQEKVGGDAVTMLTHQAALSSWPSPQARDHEGANLPGNDLTHNSRPLNEMVRLASWPTPMAGTPAQNGNNAAGNNDASRKTVALCAGTGPQPNGSIAETASGGQLNPAHSRWLMGYPAEWDSCGATAMQSCRSSRRNSSGRT